jgi:hypothetical protein
MDILIPKNLFFGDCLPACLAQTWMQLRCLAGEAGHTAPFSSEGLARLTGKSLATLYRHLRRLKEAGMLDWRCFSSGLQIYFAVAGEATGEEQGGELKACATGGREGEVPAGMTGEQNGEVAAEGVAILRADSQNCACASLNPLTDSLINLTRVEARFSLSRMLSISRLEPVKLARAKNPLHPLKPALPKKALQAETPPIADSPAAIYRQVARLTPNPAQRELLEQQVQDLPRWRATLEHWLAHRWNPRNLPGMLDLYRRGGAGECRYCPKPEGPKTAEAFMQLRERYGAGQGGVGPGSARLATGGVAG